MDLLKSLVENEKDYDIQKVFRKRIFLLVCSLFRVIPAEIVYKILSFVKRRDLFVGADLRGAYFYCGNLKNADLRYADLRWGSFVNSDFRYSDLCYADLRYTNMLSVDFEMASVRGANFFGSNMECANFFNNCLEGADFRGSIIRKGNFYKTNLKNALFDGADLRKADFTEANLEKTKFVGADIDKAIFRDTFFYKTDFRGNFLKLVKGKHTTNMYLIHNHGMYPKSAEISEAENRRSINHGFPKTDEVLKKIISFCPKTEIRKILKKRMIFLFLVFKKTDLPPELVAYILSFFDRNDLFKGGDLSATDFRKEDLRGVDFENTNIENSIFFKANLEGANLRGANLTLTDFTGANLKSANLEGANLTQSWFSNTKLENASFKNGDITGTYWDFENLKATGANFKGVKSTREIKTFLSDSLETRMLKNLSEYR